VGVTGAVADAAGEDGTGAGGAGGGAVLFGTLEQALNAAATAAHSATRASWAREGPWRRQAMLWMALEIVLGLALFIGIVWWTLPKKEKRSNDPPAQ